jgi:hypothetical protein
MGKTWKRAGEMNRHHLRPRSRGGDSLESNLLVMDIERHNAWHFLFQNQTLDEIIEALERLRSMKRSKHWRKQIN